MCPYLRATSSFEATATATATHIFRVAAVVAGGPLHRLLEKLTIDDWVIEAAKDLAQAAWQSLQLCTQRAAAILWGCIKDHVYPPVTAFALVAVEWVKHFALLLWSSLQQQHPPGRAVPVQ